MSRPRSRARERALQALYQWQLAGQDLVDIERQFLDEQDMDKTDLDYFHELLHGVPRHLTDLDGVVGPFLDRTVSQVDPVERAILRLGVYELKFRLDIPYRVVINESVELAKRYGAEQGHRYINGVLDKAAQQLRAAEVKAARKR